jgi:hypothetical protein
MHFPTFATSIGRRLAQAGLLALVSLPLAVPAIARQLVVIAASNTELAPGQILDGEVAVTLPQGASVSLIGEDGKPISLQGPFSGKPAPGSARAEDGGLLESLARLVNRPAMDSTALGTVRSSRGQPERLNDPWSIDSRLNSVGCMLPGIALTLWRAENEGAAKLTLSRDSTGETAEIRWAPGEQVAVWPARLPAVPEERYVLRRGSNLPRVVQLRIVPKELPTDAHRAAWMGERGCEEQGRRLLRSVQ